jgi:hypothetical protein
MKAGRYGMSAFKTSAVLARIPVAPIPTLTAANASGPMQQIDAKHADTSPPIVEFISPFVMNALRSLF